mmetsp:Transcript_36640/g.117523  ORF Transcript_36640/g.117523 Transcript_36640/m.117523 type:complete len:186 (-) Transcript_36640:64-621(-)
MNDHVELGLAHRKFDAEVSTAEAAHTKLTVKRRADATTIHYLLWLDAAHPGYFVLSWLPQNSTSARHEFVEVKPDGLYMRQRLFKSVDLAINHFKRHAQDWLTGGGKRTPSAASSLRPPPQQQPPPRSLLSGRSTPGRSTPSHRPSGSASSVTTAASTAAAASRQPPTGRGSGRTLPAWMTANNA